MQELFYASKFGLLVCVRVVAPETFRQAHTLFLGAQKAHKHQHFMGYPYLIGLPFKGVYMVYP